MKRDVIRRDMVRRDVMERDVMGREVNNRVMQLAKRYPRPEKMSKIFRL